MRSVQCLILFWITFALSTANGSVAVDTDWLTLNESNLEIIPGSPLDFNLQFPNKKIEAQIEINVNGQFTSQGAPIRFLCGPMNLTPNFGGYPDKDTADRYAKQLSKAGYNLVRFQFIEATLMTGRQNDFDYNPEQLDRFYYFLSALKKEGIYWMIDALSSSNGAYGNVYPHRWINKYDLILKMLYDESAKQHWNQLVDTLFSQISPYTGKTILQDSALMGVILVNEGGPQFRALLKKQIPNELKPSLIKWLKNKYSNSDLFENIWGQSISVLENDDLNLPMYDERSSRMDDVLSFYIELEQVTEKWMSQTLRKQGYKGLITSNNSLSTTHMAHARSALSWVDMHSYAEEISYIDPKSAGAKLKNESSFDQYLHYITNLGMSRLKNRAFSVSEYSQPFWNEWRRESGLLMPAYAALHDWGAICQHASTPVDLAYDPHAKYWKQLLLPYNVGLDPVARAGETLAALLYRRSDVQTSKQPIQVVFPGGDAEKNSRYWGVSDTQAMSALVSRTEIKLVEDDSKLAMDLSVLDSFTVSAETKTMRTFAKLVNAAGVTSVNPELDALVKAKLPQNITQSGNGIYQSDTGQLIVDFKKRRFSLSTPKTEAAVFDKIENSININVLNIIKSDKPAMVALSSLDVDGSNLENSKHMLLIVSTDALNSQMLFVNNDREELAAWGHLPVRIRPVRVELEIKVKSKLVISAMRQSGELYEMIPTIQTNIGHKVVIDLNAIKNGPTFYFDILLI